jgi:hypothetical protein
MFSASNITTPNWARERNKDEYRWFYRVFELLNDTTLSDALTAQAARITALEARVTELEDVVNTGVSGYTTTAVNLTLTDSHNMVEVTAAGVTITLPAAAPRVGRMYTIDNSSAGNITVDGNGAELIQGETTQTVYPASSMSIYSNGTGWRIK